MFVCDDDNDDFTSENLDKKMRVNIKLYMEILGQDNNKIY